MSTDDPPFESTGYEPRPIEEHTPEFLAAADAAQARFAAEVAKLFRRER
jgi:hypothetical protein